MRTLITCCALLISTPSLAEKPSAEKWIPIFNGKDLNDWKIKISGYELGDNHKNTFRVENGLLIVSYDKYEEFEDKFGHIFYKTPYSHYRLRVEYRFVNEQVKGGPGWAFRNNGIMLHCQSPESMDKDQSFPVSLETQLLGGKGRGDRPTANLCTPGTHVVMDNKLITRHCINSKSKTYHGDQWVTVEVEVRGNEVIKHILDGETVLAFNKPQLDENDKYGKKRLDSGAKKMIDSGYIALQSESHDTEFRKIELLVLKKD